jgi:hypothetical protein
MLFRHSAYSARGIVPPLLIKEECLVDKVEGPFFPFFTAKPSILRQWLDTGLCLVTPHSAPIRVIGKADCLAGGLID